MYPYHHLYKLWTEEKKQLCKEVALVSIENPIHLSSIEKDKLAEQINSHNFCIYSIAPEVFNSSNFISPFGEQCGLRAIDSNLCAHEDSITRIEKRDEGLKKGFIPYSDKKINWHTDGYYNVESQIVYAFILHCQQPADSGGENGLIDQDEVFIHLYNENPKYLEALMDDTVMTIPANVIDGNEVRPETTTAIFKVINQQHQILMRYSQRKRNIHFKQDNLTQEAISCLDEYLNNKNHHHYIRLKAGQGVLANNVLHMRTGFTDQHDAKRLYYRARYYNRINLM